MITPAINRIKSRLQCIRVHNRLFSTNNTNNTPSLDLYDKRSRFTAIEARAFNETIPHDAKRLVEPYLNLFNENQDSDIIFHSYFACIKKSLLGKIAKQLIKSNEIHFPPNNTNYIDIHNWFKLNENNFKTTFYNFTPNTADPNDNNNKSIAANAINSNQNLASSDNNTQIDLELGSGFGEWISSRANKNPSINYIAFEQDTKRAFYTLGTYLSLANKKLKKQDAKGNSNVGNNLRVICSDAKFIISNYFLPNTISNIYINFPVVYTKVRHEKRLLIDEQFVKDLYKILKPQGKLFIVTDHQQLLHSMINNILNMDSINSNAQPLFKSIFPSPYYSVNKLPTDYELTVYGKIWRSRNLDIYAMQYEKI